MLLTDYSSFVYLHVSWKWEKKDKVSKGSHLHALQYDKPIKQMSACVNTLFFLHGSFQRVELIMPLFKTTGRLWPALTLKYGADNTHGHKGLHLQGISLQVQPVLKHHQGLYCLFLAYIHNYSSHVSHSGLYSLYRLFLCSAFMLWLTKHFI